MTMRYKLLGNSGLRVSELCLGTMTFGTELGWGTSKEESRKIYDAFMEAGGNFIDTANLYTGGTSEKFVGEFICSDREQVVLATKYTDSAPTNNPNAAGNQRKNMVQSLEASLKRLCTDYIDVYWLHAWDFMTPVEEVMRAFDDMVRAGKVFYIGISDTPAWSVSQVAVNWVRAKNVIPLLGATKQSQITDNLGCLNYSLSAEYLRRLDEASKIELGFPHDFLLKTREVTYGGLFDAIDNHRDGTEHVKRAGASA